MVLHVMMHAMTISTGGVAGYQYLAAHKGGQHGSCLATPLMCSGMSRERK